MIPSAGYFRGVNCPFFASGLCHRPYCHFKHAKSKDPTNIRTDDCSTASTGKDTVETSEKKPVVHDEASISVQGAQQEQGHPFAADNVKKTSSHCNKSSATSSQSSGNSSDVATSDAADILVPETVGSQNITELVNVVVFPGIESFASAVEANDTSTSTTLDEQATTDASCPDGDGENSAVAIPHYSPSSPSAASSPSFSPPQSPSALTDDDASDDDDTTAARSLLCYQSRPEDFEPLYSKSTAVAGTTSDGNPVESTSTSDAEHVVVDSSVEEPMVTCTGLEDTYSYSETGNVLGLEELLNAYNTPQESDLPSSVPPSGKKSRSAPAVLSAGLNVLSDKPKSKSKPSKAERGEKSTAALDDRDMKYMVQDAMAAEGRNKRRVAYDGAAAVHQPRGRSGNVPLRRRPASAGMLTAAVATSHEPAPNPKPGQGYDNDIYTSIVKKRVAHPSGPTDQTDITSKECSGVLTSSSKERPQAKKAVAVSRPSLPLHLGGKIARNVRQRLLDQFFDSYIAQGMPGQEAHDLAMSEEGAIFKRSTSRQLYNNMAAVKVGRLRSQVNASANSPSELTDKVAESSRGPTSNLSLFRKVSDRVVSTPSWASSAQSTATNRGQQPVAMASTATSNLPSSSTSNSLFSTPGSQSSHRLGSRPRESLASSSSSSSASSVGASRQRPRPTISARTISPSLAAAMQEMKSIHEQSQTRRAVGRSGATTSSAAAAAGAAGAKVTKRKAYPEDDVLSTILPAPKKLATGSHGNTATLMSDMKIPKIKSAAQRGGDEMKVLTEATAKHRSALRQATSSDRGVSREAAKSGKLSRKPPPSVSAGKTSITSTSGKLSCTPIPFSQSGQLRKPKSVQEELTEEQFFSFLIPYLATERQLRDNGYPQPAAQPNKAIIPHIEGRRKPHPPQILSAEEARYFCSRCGTPFVVKRNETYDTETCTYHFGRAHKHRENGVLVATYSCCSSDSGTTGCQVAKCHVWDGNLPSEMPISGYVATQTQAMNTSSTSLLNIPNCFSLLAAELLPVIGRPKVLAFDCEMSYTTIGLSLTRITLIDFNLNVLMDTHVAPRAPVVDYNTRFSGVTDSDLRGVTTRLEDIQDVLRNLIGSETILIGHSLESDLKAIKMMHGRVVDTSIVFPHKLGPPFKKALKTLAADKLNRVIQQDDSGHSSAEDAIVAMELMLQKVKDDIRKSSRKSSTVLVRKF